MFKIKGVYRWKLIDAATGKVDLEGEQENLITDALVANFRNLNGNSKSSHTGQIVLSETSTPLPGGVEYREFNAANGAISSDAISGYLAYTYDDPAGLQKISFNFPTPSPAKTWRIIGLDLGAISYKFQSFVELTVAITQQTNQFLFVEYSMTVQYAGGLLNSPNNTYVRDWVNEDIFARMVYFAYRVGNSNSWVRVTPFRYPATLNNVGRRCGIIDSIEDSSPNNNGCRYGQDITKSYLTTELPGPIGCPIWMYYSDSGVRPNAVTGVYDTNIVPSISRVYIHPGANKDQVFSDPAHPPLSKGSLTVTGTPTNKVPIVMRLKVTKAGDASDVVDETFTATPGSDVINVTQSEWDDDDIVQFTTTNTLPDPLATSTDYYLINGAGGGPYTFEVSISQGGSKIDITDTGTGTHTIIRQNTGEYLLTMEPCLTSLSSNTVITSTTGYINNAGIKAIVDTSGSSTPNDWNVSEDVAVIGREGEYIYTVQYDATELQIMICRQYIYSPESSESLHSLFGTSGIALWCAVRGANAYSDIIYIATDDGIYLYNFGSPATPVLITLTGSLLKTEVTELAYDSVNDNLYAGHDKGMTRIDITSVTAGTVDNKYDNDSEGDLLSGLTDEGINCIPGTLTAHNGRILWARVAYGNLWLYDDSIPGYTNNSTHSTQYGGTINKNDDKVVVRAINNPTKGWNNYTVNVTGPTTGDWTSEESFATGWDQSIKFIGQMIQLSSTKFLAYVAFNVNVARPELYEVGVGVTTVSNTYVPAQAVQFVTTHAQDRRLANMRNGIDVSEGNMGLYVQMQDYTLLNYGGHIEFGWDSDSTAWSKDSTVSRQITESGVDDLSQGVAVQFNNAVGEDWDQQFVLDEHLTFMVAPVLIKDNLQTYTLNTRAYHCGVKHITDETHVVPAGQVLVIDKAPLGLDPDPDYRDLETLDWVLGVHNLSTATDMSQVASPPGDEQYSVVGLRDGTFEFDSSQIGDNIRFNYNYTVYF